MLGLLDALRAKRMVEAELERRWKQLSTRKPMDAFRLGEFCLRNGQADRVAITPRRSCSQCRPLPA